MELHNQMPQDIEQVREEVEKCNYQLNTLFDISKDIFGTLNIELILKNSLLFTLGNFGVIKGFIGLFDLFSEKSTQFVSQGFQSADSMELQKKAQRTLLQNNLKDTEAMDVRCGDLELLTGSVDCVLPFKVDDHRSEMLKIILLLQLKSR